MYGPLSVHVPERVRALHARVYTVRAILFLYLHRSTYRDSLCIKNAHILVYFFSKLEIIEGWKPEFFFLRDFH